MTCIENITIINLVICFPIHFKVLENDYFLKGPLAFYLNMVINYKKHDSINIILSYQMKGQCLSDLKCI